MKVLNQSLNMLFSLLRIGLGISWFHEGLFKLQAKFDISGLVPSVVNNVDSPMWYKTFMEHVVGSNVAVFNVLIPWGELLVGLGLIIGILTVPALIAGIFMGINYWLADMIYIYPVQLAVGFILVLMHKQASYFGISNGLVGLKRRRNRSKIGSANV
ncbi:DoxX family protein [Listeria booriae]|uniref:DoxX family protein n=1 Tax=Listeria booriae TaxID=1552123 RepID=A0A841YJF7_9LIST|nr:DoxX family protein [Listeria booriae]MBC1400214.1 DoxX family protein [Listeria booriae]MBC1614727.1 DoxX family protein [Listeria booriae]MBC2320975.1 DoxX family protein [Listeria booriae]